MTTFAIVDVGCIECGNPTVFEAVVDQLPDNVDEVLALGDERVLDYAHSRIALRIEP